MGKERSRHHTSRDINCKAAGMSGRTIWVVRHAEREDNINCSWLRQANPLRLKSDNSPLSKRGHQQAKELAQRFATQQLDHVFASPFERTMETATAIVSARKGAMALKVKVEPGLVEALYLCERPPGFESADSLMT